MHAEACVKLGTTREPESVGTEPPYGDRYLRARERTRVSALKTTPTTTAKELASRPASLL